jgi:hypothetical protein
MPGQPPFPRLYRTMEKKQTRRAHALAAAAVRSDLDALRPLLAPGPGTNTGCRHRPTRRVNLGNNNAHS